MVPLSTKPAREPVNPNAVRSITSFVPKLWITSIPLKSTLSIRINIDVDAQLEVVRVGEHQGVLHISTGLEVDPNRHRVIHNSLVRVWYPHPHHH